MQQQQQQVDDPQEAWRVFTTLVFAAGHTVPVVLWFLFYTVVDCYPERFGKYRIQRNVRPYSPNLLSRWFIQNGILGSAKAKADLAAVVKEHGASARFLTDRRVFFKTALQNTFQHFLTVPGVWYFLGFDFAMNMVPSVEHFTQWEFFPSVPKLLAHLLVYVLCEDFLFYWAHRLLHVGPLYRAFHKRHHEHHTPFTLGAEYSHPVESILGNFVPFLAGPMLCGGHLFELVIWFQIRMTKTAEAHSGYQIPGVSIFSVFSCCVPASMHDYHHSDNKGSYGSFLSFWDWICCTDADYNEHCQQLLKSSQGTKQEASTEGVKKTKTVAKSPSRKKTA